MPDIMSDKMAYKMPYTFPFTPFYISNADYSNCK